MLSEPVWHLPTVKKPAPRRPHAIERNTARRQSWLRLTRTLVLGTVATVLAIVWLGEQYGIERDVIFEFLGTSVLFVLALAALGLVGTALLMLLKKILRRD